MSGTTDCEKQTSGKNVEKLCGHNTHIADSMPHAEYKIKD